MSCPAHEIAVANNWITLADVDLIREVAARLPKHHVKVVDIGVGAATSALSVLAERQEDIEIISIDINATHLHWAGIAMQNVGLSHLWRGLQSDSVAAAHLVDGPIDMLLLDTSHEYEPTVAELEVWLPKVAAGGLVWLHDYVGAYPGCTQAIDEAMARGELKQWKIAGLGWAGEKL